MTDTIRDLESVLHDAVSAARLSVDSGERAYETQSEEAHEAADFARGLTERLVRQALTLCQELFY